MRVKSLIDPNNFRAGYTDGWMASKESKIPSERSTQTVPSDYSRGFLAGHKDGELDLFRTWSDDPYNETVLELREKYPDEYPDLDHATCVSKWIACFADAQGALHLLTGHPLGSGALTAKMETLLAMSVNKAWTGRFTPFKAEFALDGSWMRVAEHWRIKPSEIKKAVLNPEVPGKHSRRT